MSSRGVAELELLVATAAAVAAASDGGRAPLIGLSGIDGSGKSTLARQLARRLAATGIEVALVPLDRWHVPYRERLLDPDPAACFYERAFRWEELFGRLIQPLRARAGVDLVMTVNPVPDAPPFPRQLRYPACDLVLNEGRADPRPFGLPCTRTAELARTRPH